MAKAMLDDHASSVHIVGQVITQRIPVQEREIAVRHNDLVLLKLSQSGSARWTFKEVNGRHPWLGQDLGLQQGRPIVVSA